MILDEDYWVNLWAFGTSADGLGLTATHLWALTPREFHALIQVWKAARRPLRYYYAGLQATIHNAWMRGEHRPAFTPNQWLPAEDQIHEEPRTLEETIYNNRLALFEASCQWAATQHNPEVDAQLDALQAKDWRPN